jgi:hypothetical protein
MMDFDGAAKKTPFNNAAHASERLDVRVTLSS